MGNLSSFVLGATTKPNLSKKNLLWWGTFLQKLRSTSVLCLELDRAKTFWVSSLIQLLDLSLGLVEAFNFVLLSLISTVTVPNSFPVVTCGADRSIKVWNYLTLELELSKEFEESIESVALHPTGTNSVTRWMEQKITKFHTKIAQNGARPSIYKIIGCFTVFCALCLYYWLTLPSKVFPMLF